MKRESLVFMAQVAEQTKRYSDMTMYMKIVCLKNIQLNEEERELLNVGYMNMMTQYRDGIIRVQKLIKKA